MNGAAILKSNTFEKRTYESASNYKEWVAALVKEFGVLHPQVSTEDAYSVRTDIKQVAETDYLDLPYHITVSDLVDWSRPNTMNLDRALGVSLPESFLNLYERANGALLLLRNIIGIWPAKQVVEETLKYHSRWEATGPVRVVMFAMTWSGSSRFALRRGASDWTVQLIDQHERPSCYQSQMWDQEPDDPGIDDWLERLFSTDGYPLKRGNEEYEEPYVWRVK